MDVVGLVVAAEAFGSVFALVEVPVLPEVPLVSDIEF